MQVREFWHALEEATNERQQAMFQLLNSHMKRLAQRVEAAVGEALEVQLEPTALRLDPPTAQQFHADLQNLFDTGECLYSPRQTASALHTTAGTSLVSDLGCCAAHVDKVVTVFFLSHLQSSVLK